MNGLCLSLIHSYYEPAGVAEFQKFIKYENVMPGVQKGETVFFGAWEGQELCGVSALNLRQGGHIALLFVLSLIHI